jgi:hypothetical protein
MFKTASIWDSPQISPPTSPTPLPRNASGFETCLPHLLPYLVVHPSSRRIRFPAFLPFHPDIVYSGGGDNKILAVRNSRSVSSIHQLPSLEVSPLFRFGSMIWRVRRLGEDIRASNPGEKILIEPGYD